MALIRLGVTNTNRQNKWYAARLHMVHSCICLYTIFIPPPNGVGGGILDSPCPSVRNYQSRKITARRWLHEYVGAECGASSFTWYLYQIRNIDVRLSVRPSVCRWHGFRSISQVCFGISISKFICMLMVVIGRSLLIFSDITFKMAAWQPYWIFWFPDSNFTLALIINSKFQRHDTYVYG